MSWLFSQALVEEFSAATCSAGEPSARLNVMPTLQPFWRNGKTTDVSTLSRSGLTCAVLTADLGAELLTWFLAASHARTSPLQVREPASTANDQDSGERWLESSVRFDLDTFSWRTHRCLWDEALPWSSLTLPRWGMTRNGVVYQHPTSERPINAIGSGSWPTPTVAMAKGSSLGALTRKTGRSRSNDRLDYAVEVDGKNGRLNPEWVEWLMGWPTGWTGLKPLAMDRFHEWQQKHGGIFQSDAIEGAQRFSGVNKVKQTKFQQWLDQVTVAEVSRRMTALGIEYSCTVSAVYQWRKGETVPRPEKIRGLVKISRGQLTLKDVHDHIDAASADWRGRQEVNA